MRPEQRPDRATIPSSYRLLINVQQSRHHEHTMFLPPDRPTGSLFCAQRSYRGARRLLRDAHIVLSPVPSIPRCLYGVRPRGRSAHFAGAPCTPCTTVVQTALQGLARITPTVRGTGITLKTGWPLSSSAHEAGMRSYGGNIWRKEQE